MRLISRLVTLSLLAATPALAQATPPLPTIVLGQVDIAASTLGLIPTLPGGAAPVPVAPTADIATGCSNQPTPTTRPSGRW